MAGSEEAGEVATGRWRLGTRIAFRFAFVYFLLDTLYVPFHLLPIPPFLQVSEMYNSLWSATVPWVSRHVLHLSHDFAMDYLNTAAGSKDTTYAYVQVLCYLVIAALATMIWSLLDRRRCSYEWLHKWFTVYLRLYLATVMIPYGVAKLVPAQFPPPSLSKLLETYGESSPMGLMWTFMGASRLYSFFGGATEVLAGLLLVVPWLATLGALVCIGIISNVLMLNLGYDIPVKLVSIHLILIAGWVVVPDLKRLADFFVLNRRVEPAPAHPLFRRRWLNGVAIALQVAFGVVLLTYNLYHTGRRTEQAIQTRGTVPLYGIWSVDEFKIDGAVRPPLLTDPTRWHRIIIESAGDAAVQPMSGPVEYRYLQVDERNHRFTLTRYGSQQAKFTYESPQPDVLILTGKIGEQPVNAILHKEDESKFLLNGRGLHWIQEFSVNR
jgi:uncharacterized membrane protein YphA (DoxX/SURF4 family)